MKKIISGIMMLTIFCFSNVSAEEFEEATIFIKPSSDLSSSLCPEAKWKNKKVVWTGVVDNRESKYVGMQDQKRKPDIRVKVAPDLDKVFSDELFKVFSACGVNLVKKATEGVPLIGIEIEEFYAGAKKNIFTGQSTAKSVISIVQRKGGTSSKITVNVEFESKGLRSKRLSKLEETINELFVESIKRVIEQDSIKDML
jgi:uncharacterized lipoprotein YajG